MCQIVQVVDFIIVRLKVVTTNRNRINGLDIDDDDDDYDSYDENKNASAPENQVYLTPQGHCERLVLMAVLAPIGHTYLAVAFCLNSLLGTGMIEADFIKLCVSEVTSRVNESGCKYGE